MLFSRIGCDGWMGGSMGDGWAGGCEAAACGNVDGWVAGWARVVEKVPWLYSLMDYTKYTIRK